MSNVTHYNAVRSVATGLQRWRTGDLQAINGELDGMPKATYVAASMTLAEALAVNLANTTGKTFDALIEGVVAEMIGFASEEPRDE